ncbi:MAG: XisH family protein [Saprospiraceae bacterium]|nr:XisH family protein [Saprospiraceae bacterium]
MARDTYHDAVRRALEKEGWTITDEQYKFSTGEASFEIDLFAEKLIVAERGNDKIAVEVKSFRSQSPMNKFHEAVGQYDNYLFALEEYAPERILYLALPIDLWETFFQKPFVQLVISRKRMRLIIYDQNAETIEKWIR